MTTDEKKRCLYNYCNDVECEECILRLNNDVLLPQMEQWEDVEECPNFHELSQETLDKAIKLIQESKELDKAHDVNKLIEAVNYPKHYQGKNECIDVMIAMFGVEAVKHFCMCNAYKYRFRSAMKNGEEDIKKAEWYEDKLIELGGAE